MSLESAMAVLEKAHVPMPSTPGADPDKSEVVKSKDSDSIKDVKFDLKSDSLKEEEKTQDPKKEEEKKEEVKVEAPKTEPKDENKELMSQRFALLAKKEKVLVQTQQQLKAKETDINEKAKAIENFEKFKQEVKVNPMLALKELGINYNDLTKYVLEGKMPEGNSADVKAVRDELQALRDQLSEERKLRQEARQKRQQETQQQTIVAFQSEIGDYVKGNPDKYELINLNEANNLVFQTIEHHFNETKRIMSIGEGCDVVEKYLEDQLNKNLQAKKLASRLQEKRTPQVPQRTLNNEMTSSAPSMLPAKTEQDRMNRAMAALSR